MTREARPEPLRFRWVETTLTDRDLARFREQRRVQRYRYRIVGGERSVRYKVRFKVGKPLDRPPELPDR